MGDGADSRHGLPRRLRQRPGRGRVMSVLGWTLFLGGCLITYGLGHVGFRVLVYKPSPEVARLPLWSRVVTLLAGGAAGLVLLLVSRRLRVRGRRHRARVITSFEELHGERYVLYLRPFVLDQRASQPLPEAPGLWTRSPLELPGLTLEGFLVHQLREVGRVVAVGQPGERLPPLGAERGYLPLRDWQPTVSELIRGAHVVVLSVGPAAGTVWEYTEALRVLDPRRLVLLVFCNPAEYDLFRVNAARAYAARAGRERGVGSGGGWPPPPKLPDLPPPRPPRTRERWDLGLRGLISFDSDWRPRVTPFAPRVPPLRHAWTLRRLVRRELAPVLAPLARLPAARPGRGPT